MSFTSDSWKKTGGINRTSSHNLVRIPKAIKGSLKIYENTNHSNITIDGNSHLRINKGTDLNGNSGTIFGTYRIGQDVSSNIYDPRVLIRMTTDPIRNNDWAFFMSESANGNVDRGNLTLVVADNSTSQNDKFIIRGYDEASKKNTDIAYFSSLNGAVFNKVGIGLSEPRSEAILDISGIAYGTYPVTSDPSFNSQLSTIEWVQTYVTQITAGNASWQQVDGLSDIYLNDGNLALLTDDDTTTQVNNLYGLNTNDVPKLYVDGTAFVTKNTGIKGNLSVGYDESYVNTNALDVSGNIFCQGNFGIGTTTPANRFQLQDDSNRAIKFGQGTSDGIHHMDYYNAGNTNTHSPDTTKNAIGTTARGFYINYYSKEDIILNGDGGNVMIGTNSSSGYKLEVNGNVKATSFNASSDIRLKENITNLDNSLNKICNIRGVNYNWKNDENYVKHSGVIAQEVDAHIPEAVCKNDSDKYSVDYNAIIGHLIESVKTLKMEIEELKSNK